MRIGIFILLGVVFFLGAMLLSTNLLQVLLVEEPSQLIDPDDVSGSAVLHSGIPYTLGFGQQNLIIVMLNSMKEIEKPNEFEKSGKLPGKLPFDELIIYHFDTPSDHIIGKELEGGNIVLSFKTDSHTRYLSDMSGGQFLKVLKQAYQP